MDPVLAKPADLCCLKGAIHDGEARGKMEDIDGVPTYVATPTAETSNGNIIIYFPDAFGLHINSFLIMDAFADCGYLTLGIDYFLGVRYYPSKRPDHNAHTRETGWSRKAFKDTAERSKLRFPSMERKAF